MKKPRSNKKDKERIKGIQIGDLSQTPWAASRLLLPYIPADWVIWEPACGKGYISSFWTNRVNRVISTDLITTGHDFHFYEPDYYDIIISNPPYEPDKKEAFVRRCYQLDKPFALVMQTDTLGSQGVNQYFMKYGVQAIQPSSRINFGMYNKGWEGGAQFPAAWFTWGLDLPLDLMIVPFLMDNNSPTDIGYPLFPDAYGQPEPTRVGQLAFA